MNRVSTHILAVLITLILVFLWLGVQRPLHFQQPALVGNPEPGPAAGPSRPPAVNYTLPAVAPPDLPADVLKRSDADEEINIRVYAAVNRSVVNITTASEGGGQFGD